MWELDNRWEYNKKMGNVSCRHQSKFFKICEKTIPYLPFIFKNKRQRVKCRWYFRYHWWEKCEKEISNILLKSEIQPIDWKNIEIDIPEYWELHTKSASE